MVGTSSTMTIRKGVEKSRTLFLGFLHLDDLVGQRPAVLVGDGHILAHRETMFAQPVHRLVVGDVIVVVVEEPARTLARQMTVRRIVVRRKAAHDTGALSLGECCLVQQ